MKRAVTVAAQRAVAVEEAERLEGVAGAKRAVVAAQAGTEAEA